MATKRESDMTISRLVLLMAGGVGMLGCAADMDTDDETLSETSAAIFQAGCATLDADNKINGEQDPQWLLNAPSAQHNGCLGARIVDVAKYQEGSDVKVTGATVAWGDVVPDDKWECERMWLGASVYKKVGSEYVHIKDNKVRGIWVPGPPCTPGAGLCLNLDECIPPAVTYVSSVSDGQSYRFVGSARRLAVPNGDPSGSHFLRNVQFNARVDVPVVIPK
jgi:hypothetical protein